MTSQLHFDRGWVEVAKHYSQFSPDPSTKCGAVLVHPVINARVGEGGWNCFPPGIAEDSRLHDREVKYEIILHAEENAVLNAGIPTKGLTLYTWPLAAVSPTCHRCARLVIGAGIRRVVAARAVPPPDGQRGDGWPLSEKWRLSGLQALALYEEAGVVVDLLDPWA